MALPSAKTLQTTYSDLWDVPLDEQRELYRGYRNDAAKFHDQFYQNPIPDWVIWGRAQALGLLDNSGITDPTPMHWICAMYEVRDWYQGLVARKAKIDYFRNLEVGLDL